MPGDFSDLGILSFWGRAQKTYFPGSFAACAQVCNWGAKRMHNFDFEVGDMKKEDEQGTDFLLMRGHSISGSWEEAPGLAVLAST